MATFTLHGNTRDWTDTPRQGVAVNVAGVYGTRRDPHANLIYIDDVEHSTDRNGDVSFELVTLPDLWYRVSSAAFGTMTFPAPPAGETVDIADLAPAKPAPFGPVQELALRLTWLEDNGGESAYETAVRVGGFEGSEAEWLASLRGVDGRNGPILGYGSPNGRQVGSPGDVYRDLSRTNGAVQWRKDSGTGNTGWVLESGDTGWRNVTGNCNPNSLSPSNTGRLLARRTVNDLRFWFDNLLIAAGSGAIDLIGTALSAEWRPLSNASGRVGRTGQAFDLSTIACFSWQLSWRNVLPATATTYNLTRPTTGLAGVLVLPCDAPYPTGALPGTDP